MTCPTATGLFHLGLIRQACNRGVGLHEYQRLLDEQSTFYRRAPDLFHNANAMRTQCERMELSNEAGL